MTHRALVALAELNELTTRRESGMSQSRERKMAKKHARAKKQEQQAERGYKATGKSKYAKKSRAQAKGKYSPNSPFKVGKTISGVSELRQHSLPALDIVSATELTLKPGDPVYARQCVDRFGQPLDLEPDTLIGHCVVYDETGLILFPPMMEDTPEEHLSNSGCNGGEL